MTRPALLLLVLSIALTACSVSAPKSAVERQREATQAAETPILAPTGENVAATEKPAKTATPNDAGTLAVMALQATERAQEADNVHFAATVAMQAKIDNYVLQTQTAQPRNQTATAQVQATQNALMVMQSTKQVEQWTATAAAPIVAATSAYLIERTKYAAFVTLAEPVGFVLFGLSVLLLSLAALSAVMRKAAPVQAEYDEPEPDREQWHAPEPGQGVGADLVSIPVEVVTGPQLRKLANGLGDGMPFTHNSFTPSENGFSEPQWRNFVNYCLDSKLATRDKPDLRNSPVTPTERLLRYIMAYKTPPTHPRNRPIVVDAAVLPGDRQIDTPIDTRDDRGSGAEDHFNILNPQE